MTTPSLTIRRSSAIGSLLERLAWRVALSGARRIRFGRLTVVLPDGNAGCSAMPPPPSRTRRRSRSTTVRRSCGCWSAARPVAARRTWTALVQPGSGGPVAARRTEPRVTGAVCRLVPRPAADPPHARPPDAAQHAARGAPEHRGPLRPGQRLLPAVPRRDADLLLRGLRDARPDAWTRSGTSTGRSRPEPGCLPASTSWRSGAGGAASRCTRLASSAAA